MIHLRDPIMADLESLFALDQVCFPPEIAYSRGEFRSLLRSKAMIGVIAEEDRRFLAFTLAQLVKGGRLLEGHIVTIDVAPEIRNRGVGRLLMNWLDSKMRAAGAQRVHLEVAVNNSEAIHFYERLGFAVIGQIHGYYGRALDALVMEKPIGDERDPIP